LALKGSFSRALAPSTMSSHEIVARADHLMAGGARRNTVATSTASPTCPYAHPVP